METKLKNAGKQKRLLWILMIAVPFFTIACGNFHSHHVQEDRTTGVNNVSDFQGDTHPVASILLRISIQIDKSASVIPHGVPDVTTDEIEKLAQLIKSRGGGLAVGIISGQSDEPNVELHIAPPSVPPVAPSKNLNVFQRAILTEKFDKDQSDYKKSMDDWGKISDSSIAEFMRDVTPLVNRKANARKTDIGGAIRRAELFLNAPVSSKVQRYLILVTDLDDNGEIQFPQARDVTVLLVSNALANVSLLKGFHVVQFENINQALQFLSEKEAHNGRF